MKELGVSDDERQLACYDPTADLLCWLGRSRPRLERKGLTGNHQASQQHLKLRPH